MIRLFHVYFPSRTLALALSEAALIVLTLLAANFAWFGRDAELKLLYEKGLLKIAVASAVCMLCMYYYDLYDSFVLRSRREAVTRLIQGLGTTCLVLAVLYCPFPTVQFRRGLFLIAIIVVGIVLAGWRRLFLAMNCSVQLKQRTVLLGEGPLAPALAAAIQARPELGLDLLGYLCRRPGDAGLNGLPCLGGIGDITSVLQRERVNRVILTVGDRRGGLPVDELLRFKTQGVVIEDAANLYEAITGRVPVESLRPSWLLLSDGFRVSTPILLYKRALSLFGSVLALLLTLPLMVIIALAIRLDSSGPAIFRQKRVGKGGKIFTLYKFRSMYHTTDPAGNPQPTVENDRRITRVGHWLRRSRLDELPQLANILRGDMYFIGPRPFVPNTEEECVRSIPFYSQRWTLKPGATGWAQIQRGYCASLEDNIEKLGYDLFYIKNLSIGLDCLILFQTAKILLLGRGSR